MKRLIYCCGVGFGILGGVTWLTVRAQSPATGVVAVPAAETDSDGDGFTDRQEEAWNTNPKDENSYPPLFDQVQGWWPLDDGSGTAVTDASANALDGIIVGTAQPAWVADLDDTVLATDGVHMEVQIADEPALNPTKGLTVVALVKAAAGTSGMIVGKCRSDATRLQNSENHGGSFALSLQNGRPVMELWVGGWYRPLYGHRAIADGNWHSLAAAYDGFELRLYVDGKREQATHIGGELPVLAEPLVIGRVAARLADVALLSRALDDGEVILLHELGNTTGEVADAEPKKLSAVTRVRSGLLLSANQPKDSRERMLARREATRQKHTRAETGEPSLTRRGSPQTPILLSSTNTVAAAEGGR